MPLVQLEKSWKVTERPESPASQAEASWSWSFLLALSKRSAINLWPPWDKIVENNYTPYRFKVINTITSLSKISLICRVFLFKKSYLQQKVKAPCLFSLMDKKEMSLLAFSQLWSMHVIPIFWGCFYWQSKGGVKKVDLTLTWFFEIWSSFVWIFQRLFQRDKTLITKVVMGFWEA